MDLPSELVVYVGTFCAGPKVCNLNSSLGWIDGEGIARDEYGRTPKKPYTNGYCYFWYADLDEWVHYPHPGFPEEIRYHISFALYPEPYPPTYSYPQLRVHRQRDRRKKNKPSRMEKLMRRAQKQHQRSRRH